MFTKNQVVNWGVLFLLLVNIGILGTLGFLFFRRSPALEPAQRFLQDELQLTDTQIQQVEELKELYQGKMKIINEEANELKETIMEEVFRSSPDTGKVDQIADEIGAKQAELERLRFQHFMALKSLFQTEQTEKFQALIRDIFHPPSSPDSERPPESSKPPRQDEPAGHTRPPEHKDSPEHRKPPRPNEPPKEPRPEG